MPFLTICWKILMWILANKGIAIVLFLWGGTAAWGWYNDWQERKRLAMVAEIYQDAYANERERAEKLDALVLKVDKRKKVIHAKTTEAVEGLYHIREFSDGTDAQGHLRVSIPLPVIDVMRVALDKGKGGKDRRKESAAKRALNRLREALSRAVPKNGEEVRETASNNP